MKAIRILAALSFLTVSALSAAQAADKKPAAAKAPGGEVTLAGEMTCGKCALKETESCQNVLKVTEGGKEVKYYLVHNEVAKKNHSKVCSGSAKATVKGAVREDGAKKVVTASDIKYE